MYITKEEKTITSIANQFSIVDNKLVLKENYTFKSEFNEGDIVILKDNTDLIGIIEYVEEDSINVLFNNEECGEYTSSQLINIHPTLGVKLIKSQKVLKLWEEISNGKSEDLDLQCIYVNDSILNEVKFVKYLRNSNVVIDHKFNRSFLLHKKIGSFKIYKTGIYSKNENNEITYIDNKFVYYLIDNNFKTYYIGFDIDTNKIYSELIKKN